MDTIRLEYDRDDAKKVLEDMERAEGSAQTEIDAIVSRLAAAVGVSDKDRRDCIEAIYESLADMTLARRERYQDEVRQIDDQIGNAEWEDLCRSSPMVL